MRLGHSNVAEVVFGIDVTSHGLYCRKGCGMLFQPISSNSVDTLADAAMHRDAHELHLHGYYHRRPVRSEFGFAQRFTRRGKSTLNETATKRG